MNYFGRAIVTPGEASETDDELNDGVEENITTSSRGDKADGVDHRKDVNRRGRDRPSNDSLLERKLWESNINFENDVEQLALETALPWIKELNRVAEGNRCVQLTIQDAMSHLHTISEALYALNDVFDSILSDQRIPDLPAVASSGDASEPDVSVNTGAAVTAITAAYRPA